MKSLRLSLGLQMTAIVILALDLALLRVALARLGPDHMAMFGPIGLAAQIGLIGAARGRHRHRRFWFGFAATAAVVAFGSAWVYTARPQPIVDLWVDYLALLAKLFGSPPKLGPATPGHHFAVVALFFFPAQLSLTFLGGVLATGLGRRHHGRSTRVADGPPDQHRDRADQHALPNGTGEV